MEAPSSLNLNADFKSQTAQIAAAGNRPEDWKEYIDLMKAKARGVEDVKKNRMIAYLYYSAFKAIPEMSRNLAHAQLLVDYAEFKSKQDKADAEKLLSYGRRSLRQFAIVHVASAQLELKAGDRDKALRILKRAPALGAEPVSLIRMAIQRLQGGHDLLLSEVDKENLALHNSSSSSGRESSGEITSCHSTKEGSQQLSFPRCKNNTEEMQHGLDLLTQYHGNHSTVASLTSAPPPHSVLSTRIAGQPQISTNQSQPGRDKNAVSRSPEVPVLTSHRYKDFGNPLGPTMSTSVSYTPISQSAHPGFRGNPTPSTGKKGLSHYHSTPEIRSGLKASDKPLSRLPPRRVRVDPALSEWREQPDMNTDDISVSSFKSLQQNELMETDPHHPHPFNSHPRLTNQPDILSVNTTARPHANTADRKNSDPAEERAHPLQPFQTSRSSEKLSQLVGTAGRDGGKESDKVSPDPGKDATFSRKLFQQAGASAEEKQPDSQKKLNSQEIIQMQKQLLLQQQQLLQQQMAQQSLTSREQPAAAGATYSVPAKLDNQPAGPSLVTPAKLNSQTGQKVINVNGKPYTVMRMVGRGGSAKVYQVLDPETLMMRALKCVNLSCANEVIVEGYKNEIALLQKLQHCDRVIKLFDFEFVESMKKLLVVLEYGETDLANFISQNTKKQDELQSLSVCYLWSQMVKAVQAMHREGVIHSDLKPANFMLVSGMVKLIDFGIAKALQQDKTSVLKDNMVGTPSYMSPEALMASSSGGSPTESKPKYKVGVRSDVWSLGCILYQMVYGKTPFQHVRQKLEAIVNPNHAITFPELDNASLLDILKKCLTRDVRLRPTTDDLLAHPYLSSKYAENTAKPQEPLSYVTKLDLSEESVSTASPRTQQAFLKKVKELMDIASNLNPRLSQQ